MRFCTFRQRLGRIGLALVIGGTAAFGSALTAGADDSTIWVDLSQEVYAPNTSSSCTGASQLPAIRAAVDALSGTWQSHGTSAGLGPVQYVQLPTEAAASTNPTAYPAADAVVGGVAFAPNGVPFSVNVSARDVAPLALPPFGGPVGSASVGDPATDGGGLPPQATTVNSNRALQDCAPYPASYYDADPATPGAQTLPFWNNLDNSGVSASTLDGVLFEFSQPVYAFGAFFGDLETRPAGDHPTPAYVKFIGADDSVLFEGIVPTSTNPIDDTTCGGGDINTDLLGCGNQSTHWIGFVQPPSGTPIAKVLVVVGDDDSCVQAAHQCDGTTEHLSWIGARVRLAATPPPTTTTSTTSTTAPDTTTSSTSSTSTTVADTTSTTSADPTSTTAADTTTSTTGPDATTSSTTIATGPTTTTPSTALDTTTTSSSIPDSTTTSVPTTSIPDSTTTSAPDTTTSVPATTTSVPDTSTTTTPEPTTTTNTTTTTALETSTTQSHVVSTTTTTTDGGVTTTSSAPSVTTTEPPVTSTTVLGPATTVPATTRPEGPTSTTAASGPAPTTPTTNDQPSANVLGADISSGSPTSAGSASPVAALASTDVAALAHTGATTTPVALIGLVAIVLGTAALALASAQPSTTRRRQPPVLPDAPEGALALAHVVTGVPTWIS